MAQEYLYEKLASELVTKIKTGVYQAGSKLPSVRLFASEHSVSVATAVTAYYTVESFGYIEARPKSGFYVKAVTLDTVDSPAESTPDSIPQIVTGQEMVLQLVKATNQPQMVQFGAAVPDTTYLPISQVTKAIKKASNEQGKMICNYLFPPGLSQLREQLARRMNGIQCSVYKENIVITDGCQEAIRLALRACAEPGDVIAIESPTFYGLLQVIQSLRMRAIEIPTHPEEGISIEALELAVEQWSIKACVLVPTFGNPLGCNMSDDRKQKLVDLLSDREIPIIEDDVYGEISHSLPRPKPLKAFDKKDWVIYCSSFSKSLSPGLRVGWTVSKRFYDRLEYFKYVSNLATSSVAQLAVVDILQSGKYDRYLATVRKQHAFSVNKMTALIAQFFPSGTKVTKPKGGFVLWVELPFELDTFELANRLIKKNISIAPGKIFSMTDKYNHFLRLSCAVVWNRQAEAALIEIVHEINTMQSL